MQSDSDFIRWVADRLESVYRDGTDVVDRLRKIAVKMDAPKTPTKGVDKVSEKV